MKRFLIALLVAAIAWSASATGFDPRTTGVTTATLLALRPTNNTVPPVSDLGFVKFFVAGTGLGGGYVTGKIYISQNGGAWTALDSFTNSGLVTSVFGRTGGVVATTGDYTAAQVTNAADKTTGNTFTYAAGTPILIKPLSAPSVNTKEFEVQTTGGSSLFSVDSEGDVIVHDLTVNGAFTTIALKATGTAGAGFVEIPAQSSNPAAPASGIREFATSTNKSAWIGTDTFVRTLDGTLTASRTYTLPDLSGTLSLIDVAQTISATNTFSAAQLFAAGTAAAPSIGVSTATNGLYSPGANQLGLSTNGLVALTFDSSQHALFPISGSAAAPTIAVTTATNGLYSPGANQLGIATNGVSRIIINSGGNVGINQSSPTYGVHQLGGQVRIQALGTPSAPTVTPTGTTGSTSYTYYIVAKDQNGNTTLGSNTTTTSTGNTTLNGTNYNAISWTAVTGAATYDVIRSASGGTPSSTGSIALAIAATSINDTGIAASAYTTPTRNATADFISDSRVIAQSDSTHQTAIQHDGTNGYDGTLTNQPFILRSNNMNALWIDTLQNVGIGGAPAFNGLHLIKSGTVFNGGTANWNGIFVQDETSRRGIALGYDSSGQHGIIAAATASAASDLQFWTYSGSAWGERARIDSSGRVGFGRAPDTTLVNGAVHVGGVAGQSYAQLLLGSDQSNYGTLFRRDITGSNFYSDIFISAHPSSNASTLRIFRGPSDATPALMIDTLARVGVGGTPAATLNVFGDARITSDPAMLVFEKATQTAKARVLGISDGFGNEQIRWSSNASLSGANWNRDDTAKVAWLGGIDAGADNFTIVRAAAAANPITWISLFTVSSTGNVTAGGTITERARSTPLGEWTAVSFAAGNFTANNSMTWTLASGDQTTFAYTLVGKKMTVAFTLDTTTVGGTVSTLLKIAIPGGFTSNRKISNPVYITDNGVAATGFATVNAAGTTIDISKVDGSNWTLSTDNTKVYGEITFEIQ